MTEEWRRVAGLPKIYEVSNFGKVRSWSYKKLGGPIPQKHDSHRGPRVKLMRTDGSVKWYYVHELVARAFPERKTG